MRVRHLLEALRDGLLDIRILEERRRRWTGAASAAAVSSSDAANGDQRFASCDLRSAAIRACLALPEYFSVSDRTAAENCAGLS